MRLLLVDDQILFVESLKTVLSIIADDIEIIGIANNGIEAIQWVEKDEPDIILMDVRMPEMDGVVAAKEILEKHPNIKIMMLTTYDDDEYVEEAMKYGASGYMLKDVPPADLVNSVRAIMAGTIQMSPRILNRLMEQGNSGRKDKIDYKQIFDKIELLSKREQEILFLMSQGLDNREISDKTFIAEQTVKNHMSKIYSKLGVHDRMLVLKIARESKMEQYFQYLL
jgi:DNA-binding NarL/FixJ family response regulator